MTRAGVVLHQTPGEAPLYTMLYMEDLDAARGVNVFIGQCKEEDMRGFFLQHWTLSALNVHSDLMRRRVVGSDVVAQWPMLTTDDSTL